MREIGSALTVRARLYRSWSLTIHGMKIMASIQNSVGKNQNNGVSDVLVVQAVFNKFLMAGCVPGVAPLTLDGRCGGKTGNTIISFQRGIVGTRLLDHAELWNLTASDGPLKWAVSEQPVTPPITGSQSVRWVKGSLKCPLGATLLDDGTKPY